MPFHVRDPWRLQYFAGFGCPDDVHVPIDDIDCYNWFPELRHVYDKLHVAQSQGLASGTARDLPERFPVFAKPRVNLKGMGLGSRVIASPTAFAMQMGEDDMWMELLTGPHVSTDCAVVAGKIHWIRHALGLAWLEGMFKHWIVQTADDPVLAVYIAQWIARELPSYTGMINIETIGGRIIEVQTRFADQWCDLNGKGWLEAVVGLYGAGRWQFDEPQRREGYSVPLFALHGSVPPHPAADIQDFIRNLSDVASLQITYHEGKPGEAHPMPPGGFRLAIVNCWNLESGIQARLALARSFKGVEIILP